MLFTNEQTAMREVALRFAAERLRPDYQRREAEGVIDRALMTDIGALGLIGVDLPENLGGLDQGGLTAGLVLEAIAYGDFNISCAVMMGSLLGKLVATHARPDIAADWIARTLSGHALLNIAITEPRGGTDAANIQLKARKVDGGYILSGEKASITFLDQADATIVLARSGTAEEGAGGVTAFLMPKGQQGISLSRYNDLGGKILGRGSIFFDEVFVKDEWRLGGEGKGFTQVMQGFDHSRILLTLMCISAAQASIDETWEYMKERKAMGVPIVQYQGVSFPIVEYETQIAACRALCYQALRQYDANLPHTVESAMVKSWGCRVAVDAIHQCMLTFGHYGWSMDLPHQQRMRDVMGFELGEGTAQILKLIVARERGGRDAVQYMKRKS